SHLEPYLALLERQEPSRVMTVEDVATVRGERGVSTPRFRDRTTPERGTHVPRSPDADILREISQYIRRRGLIVLISDLFDDPDSVLRGLKHLRHQRHDVIVLQVIDRAEREFPFEEPTLFYGLEGMGQRQLEPRRIREAYCREFESALRTLQRGIRNLGMDCLLAHTDDPLDGVLSRVLTRRSAPGRRSGRRR
ncbi:MAG: DUF58 domain-containing protein, partial [Planctomycetaceae bacterium]